MFEKFLTIFSNFVLCIKLDFDLKKAEKKEL